MKTFLKLALAALVFGGAIYLLQRAFRQPAKTVAPAVAPVSPPAPGTVLRAPDPVRFATPQTAGLLAGIEQVPGVAEPSPAPLRLGLQSGGAIRFLGLEPGWRLPAAGSFVAGDPAETALQILRTNRPAFGIINPRFDVVPFRVSQSTGRSYVRVQQTYAALPVLAAEAVVQVADNGDLESVIADFATELPNLDALPLPLMPQLSSDAASQRATEVLRVERRLGPLKSEAAALVVYVPEVLGLPGEPALAWEIRVVSVGSPLRARGRAIVHAENGSLLNYLDEICTGTNRLMYDDNNSLTTDPSLLPDGSTAVRAEGGPPTGVPEVDNLYDFISHTHTYYFFRHLRDGYDNAGGRIFAIARYVPADQTMAPWGNAAAGGNVMFFGDGFAVDDVVAHEYTHLVTEQTSRLIYQNASGAINEAFSDIWGELMDLFNTNLSPASDDAAANRWLIGEELPNGAIRNMMDPPDFGHPDRLGSELYRPQAPMPDGGPGGNDNGGVHTNSGVANKLCYLLIDGAAFNGKTVTAEGVDAVVTLFYEVQTNLLFQASDWRDFYFSLSQAAVNRGWSAARRTNLNNACLAVEIAHANHEFFVDRSSPLFTSTGARIQEVGIPNVVGDLGPFRSLQLGVGAVNSGGTVRINGAAGTYHVGANYSISTPVTLQSYNAPTTIAP